MKWYKSNFPGVRYRKHPTRKHGIHFDRYFAIRYQKDGVRKEEGMGWESEGMTEAKARTKLEEYMQNARERKGPTRKKEEDQIKAEQQQKERLQREKKEQDELTFKAYFHETYLPENEVEKKAETMRREKSLAKKWILPAIGDLPLKQVSHEDLQRIRTKMLSDKQSARSVQYMTALVRQVFHHARRNKKFDGEVPTAELKKEKFDNRRMRYLTQGEAKKLLAALHLRSKLVHDISLISLHCGLRFSEVVGLTWGDVDFDTGIMMVRKTKNTLTRAAYMTAAVKDMLKNRQHGKSNELIFQGNNGAKIDRVSRTFDRTVTDIGLNKDVSDPLQRIVFHSLRHTYASWLVGSHVDLYVVKELLGHVLISQTERYAHVSDKSKKDAIKALEKTMHAKKPKKKTSIAEWRVSA